MNNDFPKISICRYQSLEKNNFSHGDEQQNGICQWNGMEGYIFYSSSVLSVLSKTNTLNEIYIFIYVVKDDPIFFHFLFQYWLEESQPNLGENNF